jgi:hypothetical protein
MKDRPRDTLASRGSRADPHCHIVATFEAKESGAPGVLMQSLSISGWLDWLSEVWVYISSFQLVQFSNFQSIISTL